MINNDQYMWQFRRQTHRTGDGSAGLKEGKDRGPPGEGSVLRGRSLAFPDRSPLSYISAVSRWNSSVITGEQVDFWTGVATQIASKPRPLPVWPALCW